MAEEEEAQESEFLKELKAKAARQEDAPEEEGDGDVDFDPLAMIGGMAEEEETQESEFMKELKAKAVWQEDAPEEESELNLLRKDMETLTCEHEMLKESLIKAARDSTELDLVRKEMESLKQEHEKLKENGTKTANSAEEDVNVHEKLLEANRVLASFR